MQVLYGKMDTKTLDVLLVAKPSTPWFLCYRCTMFLHGIIALSQPQGSAAAQNMFGVLICGSQLALQITQLLFQPARSSETVLNAGTEATRIESRLSVITIAVCLDC